MFNTLKIKSEFDLEPVYASWKDAPKFNGNEKKDGTVRSWLDAIESGCKERKVPKAKWPELAQHYMGKKATARFYEVKKVMVHMHGVKYVWTWSKFTTAMTNMNCEISMLLAYDGILTNLICRGPGGDNLVRDRGLVVEHILIFQGYLAGETSRSPGTRPAYDSTILVEEPQEEGRPSSRSVREACASELSSARTVLEPLPLRGQFD